MRLDPTVPRTWLARARSNYRRAEFGRPDPSVFWEDLCFDAQQAAEKALKAVCVHLGVQFPKTPSLVYLMDLIEGAGLVVPETVRIADALTRYAVGTRYPGFDEEVGEEEYGSAVDLARRVVEWAESTAGQQAPP
ncbi:MAG: HEPN domain-containing protein [Planctomycetes bacterium]|nr:HEPN domain-containing protein [Planctomycetota bacterium]